MVRPLVTVITTTYNLVKSGRDKFLRQCLESVHNQDYENFEHIIIDGASTDGTLEILKEYEEKGWIKIYSENDNGIYQAMNRGIDKANGKYTVFMNADDCFTSMSAISDSVKLLEKTQADASYANVSYQYPDGASSLWKGDLSIVFSATPFCHQVMFTRTQLLKDIGYFNEKYKISSDYEMIIRLVLGGYKLVHLDKNLAMFRYGGCSSNKSLMINEDAQIYCDLYKDFADFTFEEAEDIYKFHTLPFKLAIKLSKYLHGIEKIKFWAYNIRKHMFQFRLSKKSGMLRICGVWIVKP